MISKLKSLWAKFKWYIIAGFALLVVILLLFWKDRSGVKQVVKATVKAQREIVAKELERKREAVKGNEEEIRKVDEKLQKLDEEMERIDTEVDSMGLKELADAWKTVSL
jgi:septal ring factor EnvC (AmiA/AmiB activator)